MTALDDGHLDAAGAYIDRGPASSTGPGDGLGHLTSGASVCISGETQGCEPTGLCPP